ncbi:restriction endonuclease subunit S [Fusicatenibacter saccharivorans]|nr:restriction endonuclease subunit S [Fusicatenibacter saccharivorans]
MVQSGHVGHAAVIPEELNNTAAHALIMFRNPKEEIEPYFLNYEYQTDKAKKKIENITTGNTIKHILASDMQEFVVDVPKYEEQKVIADYFRNIDHLITLHQCKYDTDKNRESFAWEQRKFADFTWDAGKRNREDLDLEPYAITNEHGFIRQCDAHDDFGYMKDTDRKAYNIVQPNSFAYNPARINVGSIGYYKGVENVIVSSLYEVFQTDNYVNDRFLWHWFKSDEFPRWIERLQEGSVRLYFYYDKLCECRLYMPSLEEQEKIASFLDALDRLITLHHRKHFYLKIATKTLKITIQLTKGGRKNVRIGVNDREKTD